MQFRSHVWLLWKLYDTYFSCKKISRFFRLIPSPQGSTKGSILFQASLRLRYLATPARLRCFWWRWKTFVQEPLRRWRCTIWMESEAWIVWKMSYWIWMNMIYDDIWIYTIYGSFMLFVCIFGAPCSMGVAFGKASPFWGCLWGAHGLS